jgi:hypothetical protein
MRKWREEKEGGRGNVPTKVELANANIAERSIVGSFRERSDVNFLSVPDVTTLFWVSPEL